jgi:excisionase family DNA binding protein
MTPRRTARLARQYHSGAVMQQCPLATHVEASGQPEIIESSLRDVLTGDTLTPAEAAAKLRCSRKTIHRIFRHLPGIVPVGKSSYLIPRSMFEAWVRQRIAAAA